MKVHQYTFNTQDTLLHLVLWPPLPIQQSSRTIVWILPPLPLSSWWRWACKMTRLCTGKRGVGGGLLILESTMHARSGNCATLRYFAVLNIQPSNNIMHSRTHALPVSLPALNGPLVATWHGSSVDRANHKRETLRVPRYNTEHFVERWQSR